MKIKASYNSSFSKLFTHVVALRINMFSGTLVSIMGVIIFSFCCLYGQIIYKNVLKIGKTSFKIAASANNLLKDFFRIPTFINAKNA